MSSNVHNRVIIGIRDVVDHIRIQPKYMAKLKGCCSSTSTTCSSHSLHKLEGLKHRYNSACSYSDCKFEVHAFQQNGNGRPLGKGYLQSVTGMLTASFR